ncbi:MAG: hypothetical protein ACR2H3_10580 [Acidimicrobiales bacterium]
MNRWRIALGVVLIATLALPGIMWVRQRAPGPSVASGPGGFALDLPDGWTISAGRSANPLVLVNASHPSLLGPPDAWMWVARFTGAPKDRLDAARLASIADVRRQWGDHVRVEASAGSFAGDDAVTLRYRRPTDGPLRLVPGDRIEEMRVLIVRGAQVYEIGVAGWRGLPALAQRLERHLQLGRITGTRELKAVRVDGRTAERIEFEQEIDGRLAHLITWHLRGDDGRAWQILVGGRAPVDATAALFEESFAFIS